MMPCQTMSSWLCRTAMSHISLVFEAVLEPALSRGLRRRRGVEKLRFANEQKASNTFPRHLHPGDPIGHGTHTTIRDTVVQLIKRLPASSAFRSEGTVDMRNSGKLLRLLARHASRSAAAEASNPVATRFCASNAPARGLMTRSLVLAAQRVSTLQAPTFATRAFSSRWVMATAYVEQGCCCRGLMYHAIAQARLQKSLCGPLHVYPPSSPKPMFVSRHFTRSVVPHVWA